MIRLITQISLVLSLFFAWVAYAESYYEQSTYKLVDPQSDQALFERTFKVPVDCFEALFSSKPFSYPSTSQATAQTTPKQQASSPAVPLDPQQERPISDLIPWSSRDGRENPIKRIKFGEMLMQVLAEERANGIEPQLGAPHQWSPEFKSQHPHDLIVSYPKLLVALASGVSSRYMITGAESELKHWILEQSPNSITLEQMFRSSYRLNHGDAYSR